MMHDCIEFLYIDYSQDVLGLSGIFLLFLLFLGVKWVVMIFVLRVVLHYSLLKRWVVYVLADNNWDSEI